MFLSLLGSSRSSFSFAYWHLSERLIRFFVNHRRTGWCPGTSEKCCTHVRDVSTPACSSRCWDHTSAISSSMGACGFRSLFRQVWMTPSESPFLSRLKIFSSVGSTRTLNCIFVCGTSQCFKKDRIFIVDPLTSFSTKFNDWRVRNLFRILPELFFMSSPVLFSVHVDTSVTTLAT